MSQEDMMGYANKEFKLRFDAEGKIHFEQMDGTPLKHDIDWDVWYALNKKFERKAYLYLGEGYRMYTGLWKIGVSEDFVRRQSEVYAKMNYQIECAKRRVWKIERFFHRRYEQYREEGEYFRLPELVLQEVQRLFTDLKTEEALLEWIRESDYRQWVKIIQS